MSVTATFCTLDDGHKIERSEVRVSIHARLKDEDFELVVERIKVEDRAEAIAKVDDLRRKWAAEILAGLETQP